MKIDKDTWVLVADGGKALVLRNAGTPMHPQIEVVRSGAHDNPPTREQGDDRPGRTNESTGMRRSSMEAPDLHQREERRFLAAALTALAGDLSTGAFKRLLIVAPPIALGMIRDEMPAHLSGVVTASLDKDLVHQPVPRIAAALGDWEVD